MSKFLSELLENFNYESQRRGQRMQFFKHYTNAQRDDKLCQVFEILGKEGYAEYWLLCELCMAQWDPDKDPIFSFTESCLQNVLRTKRKRLRNVLGTFSELNLLTAERSGNVWEIDFPKLLKILNRDAKYTRSKRASNAADTRQIREDKIREDKKGKTQLRRHEPRGALPQFQQHQIFLEKVSHKIQKKWLEIFQDPKWINSEIQKAEAWLMAKGTTRKNIGAFVNNWLNGCKEKPKIEKQGIILGRSK